MVGGVKETGTYLGRCRSVGSRVCVKEPGRSNEGMLCSPMNPSQSSENLHFPAVDSKGNSAL